MFRCSHTIIRERITRACKILCMSWFTRHLTSHAFPNSFYFRTVHRTHTNKGKSSQYRYESFCFEYSVITILDTLFFITDPLINAATSQHTHVF